MQGRHFVAEAALGIRHDALDVRQYDVPVEFEKRCREDTAETGWSDIGLMQLLPGPVSATIATR